MSYRLLTKGVLRLSDNLTITRDMVEWEGYRAFTKGGGVPEPMPLPPGPTLADVLASTKQRITAKRDEVQFGGAVVDGMPIKTDMSSMSLLGMALQFSGRKPARKFKVKSAGGSHVEVSPAQLAGIYDSLAERVALCWDAEAAHYAEVDDIAAGVGTDAERIAALLEYDLTVGWPE